MREFEECCKPFLTHSAKPASAEELMRSRYSAYATVNADYILQTTHRLTRGLHDADSIENWAKSCAWQRLEIVSRTHGRSTDTFGIVEFKAYYLDAGHRVQYHHECSKFVKESGEWFFVDGRIVG